MRNIFVFVVLFLFPYPALSHEYQIVRIIDGDTIIVNFHGQKERVRLLCVNTPESVHPDESQNTRMGREASRYTKSRLSGKSIDLEFEGNRRGKYGRLLAYVILAGENFNIELVREGWSPYYTKYGKSEKYHAEFLAAEKMARAEKLNIWH